MGDGLFKIIPYFIGFVFVLTMVFIIGQFVVMGYAVTHVSQLTSDAAYQACKVKAGVMGDVDALKKCEDVKPK
jgi:hypothetical protein